MTDKQLRFRAALAALALAFVAGCSSSPDEQSATPVDPECPADESAKGPHPSLHGRPVGYRQTVEAPGTVDFDNDQATSVVSPFTGPVTRIFVALGQPVAKGQPLASFSPPITRRRSAPIARPSLPPPTRDGSPPLTATSLRTTASRSARPRRRKPMRRAPKLTAMRHFRPISMGVDRSTIARAMAGNPRPAYPGSFAPRSRASSSTNRSPRASCSRPVPRRRSRSPTSPRFGSLPRSRPSDLSSVGVWQCRAIDPGNGTGPFHGTVQNIGA